MIQAHRCILSSRLKSYPCKYSRAVFLRILYLLLFWQHDNYYATLQKKALWEHYCIIIKHKRGKFSLHLGNPIL